MNILIAIPCMDTVPTHFAQSIAMLEKVGNCAISFNMGSLVYTSRNELSARAMKMNADYVLWLDSDMVFEPNILKRLFEDMDKGDIVTGLYFRRVPPYSPVLFSRLRITDEGCEHSNFDGELPDALFEVEGCGFGCVLMPTRILMDVYAEFGNMFAPINGVGEDLSFCWRARQLGYKIVCDPKISLGHVSHHVVNREFSDAFKGAKKCKQ